MSNVIFLKDEWDNFFKKAGDKYKDNIKDIIKNTAVNSIRTIKEVLPKRTGLLSKSYLSEKIDDYSYIIQPGTTANLKYADALEFGSKAHTIVPTRAKMLTIPLRDNVLTSTKSRISKPALDNLFWKLKNMKGVKKANKKAKLRQIFDECGIVLAKKSKIPAQRGKYYIRDRVMPKTQDFMENEFKKLAKEIGFN